MVVGWQKVYVFISSTFNDMHAERDYLVKRVFPQLAEWCEKRKLRLMDIDLRWGVAEEDASHHGHVVQVCLNRIDDCRPFFLCFLGQRRGWVPAPGQISPETYNQYPLLKDYAGSASITELEILHAAVSPLIVTGNSIQSKTRAFFYLRQPDYLASLPESSTRLWQVYTNAACQDESERSIHEQELLRWREQVLPSLGYSLYHYHADWDPTAVSPELALPLQAPSRKVDQWQANWNAAGIRPSSSNLADNPDEYQKALAYNQSLTAGRLAHFRVNDQPLENSILSGLKQAIAESFSDHIEDTQRSALQQELDQQGLFLYLNSEGYIHRRNAFGPLDACLSASTGCILAVTGPAGSGKSALLANWVEQMQKKNSQKTGTLYYRFIGASDATHSATSLLSSLMAEINQKQKLGKTIPQDQDDLGEAFMPLLAEAAKDQPLVLVLDALNQLDSGLTNLSWLNWNLPPNVHLVISFKDDDEPGRELAEQIREHNLADFYAIQPLSMEDRRSLALSYLSQFLKDLHPDDLALLTDLKAADNPLFLKVLLAELRLHGAHANLEQKIRESFGDTPQSAFTAVLERLENDPAQSTVSPKWLVPHLFSVLAYARRGLSEGELVSLLLVAARKQQMQCSETDLLDAVRVTLRQVRPYLARRDGRYGYFYDSFKAAAVNRYTGIPTDSAPYNRVENSWHALLSDFFGSLAAPLTGVPVETVADAQDHRQKRFVSEFPYHMVCSGHSVMAKRVLCSLPFVEMKCRFGMVVDLLDDYRLAITALKRDTPNHPHHDLQAFYRFVQDEAQNLDHFASYPNFSAQQAYNASRGSPMEIQAMQKITEGKNPVFMRLPSHRKIFSTNPARLHKLPIFNCTHMALSEDGTTLVSSSYADYSYGQYDQAVSLWCLPDGRLQRKLYGHTNRILGVALSRDGQRIASCSMDGTTRLWDAVSGKCLHVLKSSSEYVHACAFNETHKRLITASGGTVEVWSLQDGKLINRMDYPEKSYDPKGVRSESHSICVFSVNTACVFEIETGRLLLNVKDLPGPISDASLSPDGTRLVTVCEPPAYNIGGRGFAYLWNIPGVREIMELGRHSLGLRSTAFSADGSRIYTAGWELKVSVFNAADGTLIQELRGGDGVINAISLADSAGMMATLCVDSKVRLWNLNGHDEPFISNHFDDVSAVCLSADRKLAASGCGSLAEKDQTVYLWNAEKGGFIRQFARHNKSVSKTAISADGKRTLSSSRDGTINIWQREGDASWHRVLYRQDLLGISQDGRHVYGQAGRDLVVSDAVSGEPVKTLKDRVVMAVSANSSIAVAAVGEMLEIIDLQTFKPLRYLPVKLLEMKASNIKLDRDGKHAVLLDQHSILSYWNLESAACLAKIPVPSKRIQSLMLCTNPPAAFWFNDMGKTLQTWQIENNKTGACLQLPGYSSFERILDEAGTYLLAAIKDEGKKQYLSLWHLPSKKCLAAYPLSSPPKALDVSLNSVIVGEESGEVHLLQIRKLPIIPPLAEVVRIWHFGDNAEPGHWDENLTALCPYCGKRFELPVEYHESTFLQKAAKLPPAVKKVNSPAQCPHCKAAMRYATQAYDSRPLYPR